jgi:hypothetical protein
MAQLALLVQEPFCAEAPYTTVVAEDLDDLRQREVSSQAPALLALQEN